MDLCDIREIKALLGRHGFHFSKSMGQNFLIAGWVPQDIANAAGLDKIAPYWCKMTIRLLLTGTDSHGLFLQKAMELCRRERGECVWPDIPEKYCEQAYESFTKQTV